MEIAENGFVITMSLEERGGRAVFRLGSSLLR